MNAAPAAIVGWLDAVSPVAARSAAGIVGAADPFDLTELAAIARAAPARRDEFLTGRTLARRALAALGGPSCAVGVDGDRAPVWPAGYVGSIAHAGGLCVAQVAPSDRLDALGLDVEVAAAVAIELAEEIAAPGEWRALLRAAPSTGAAAALCFSAKEAAFKADFPKARRWLGFRDVAIEADWAAGTFVAHMPRAVTARELHGRFAFLHGFVASATWIETHSASMAMVAAKRGQA